MTPIDAAKYVSDALAELELVKREGSLVAWHENRMNTSDYLHLPEDEARKLEDGYQRKAAWLMGIGAG